MCYWRQSREQLVHFGPSPFLGSLGMIEGRNISSHNNWSACGLLSKKAQCVGWMDGWMEG
jgi:hypothetical protein